MAARLKQLEKWSPWTLAPAAILVAFAVTWLSNILQSVRHEPGLGARYRILVFFSPGGMDWAVAVLIAVALLAAGRRFDAARVGPGSWVDQLPSLLLLASAVVAASAVIGVLVELTNFGNGIDDALTSLIVYLAVLPVAAISGWWSYQLRGPGSKTA